MANSVDTDQTAPLVSSGSTLLWVYGLSVWKLRIITVMTVSVYLTQYNLWNLYGL